MLNCGHTPEWIGPTVERVMSNGKRIFAFAFRRWLVEQARMPGASVAGLALRHGINANQLRRWMSVDGKLSCGGEGVALLPVTIQATAATATDVAVPTPVGHIELEVFGARLKLHGDVDGNRLRVVLDALARRT
jgi:transposase